MASDPRLEATVDKILNKTQEEILSGLKTSYEESIQTLSGSQNALEQEYDRIVDEGRKEAEKIHKQIVGSSDLESRNKQLLLVEKAIDDVFEQALEKISKERNSDYSNLITFLIEEAIKTLGTSDVIIYTNSEDKDTVQSSLANFSGAELASETIECLGGVKVKSKDGIMIFDNTIDARFDRMKPLIRKEIATKFGIGS